MINQDRSLALLSSIHAALSKYISNTPPAEVFDHLLEVLLELTNSEYGFIGEVLYQNETPYLKTHAITNIAWNEETRQFYNDNAPNGLEFSNLKSLFGNVMVTGAPVFANSPQSDPRRGGLPQGHPALNAFLGLPFFKGDKMIGMVGIANRPNGYDEAFYNFLEPFLATCSTITESLRIDALRKLAEEELQKNAEEYKEHLESQVAQRTQDLNASIIKLKDTQSKLIQSKKMAALTGLVVGVAHEINTPLGVSVTASSFLREKFTSFSKEFQNNEVTKNKLETYLSDTDASLVLIEDSLAKASKQVKDFKLINTSNTYTHKTIINIKEYVERVVDDLELKNRSEKIHVQLNCSTTLEIECVPELLSQIVDILIINSFEHAFLESNKGNIVIAIKLNESNLLIDYEDDGKGLTPEDIENIFNPFNTSKRGDGHIGLGTTIMYNAITHTFKGSISCKLSSGGGLAYKIEIPVSVISS